MIVRWKAFAALAVLCACGCSSFRETHYFKSVDAKGDSVNYYRLKVTGGTFLSSSRYLSGYFDESAVDAYFSEFVQPEKGGFATTGSSRNGQEAAVRTLSASLEGKSLVLLLTTKTDAVAEGIQSIAQNEAIAATLSRIINRERLAAAREAAGELARAAAASAALARAGDRLVLGLPDAPSQQAAQQGLLDYSNRLVGYLGGPPQASLDDAARWLQENRSRLRARFLEE
jgi:hypothetical protein